MIDSLKNEFEIQDTVKVTSGNNGMPKVILTHNSGSSTEVYLHGAHVTSWKSSKGEELFFLSRESVFAPNEPIRGGIPIAFPQFSKQGPLKQHGIARTTNWELVETGVDAAGTVSAVLKLTDSEETLSQWPHKFAISLRLDLSESSLGVSSIVENTGDDPFDFQIAFHTYFKVGDIKQTSVCGLEGIPFIDTLCDNKRVIENHPIKDIDRNVDRIYDKTPDKLSIEDKANNRIIRLEKEDMPDVVVWNPWIEKAKQVADFGDDEYLQMICVETACILPAVELVSGAIWNGKTVFTVAE